MIFVVLSALSEFLRFDFFFDCLSLPFFLTVYHSNKILFLIANNFSRLMNSQDMFMYLIITAGYYFSGIHNFICIHRELHLPFYLLVIQYHEVTQQFILIVPLIFWIGTLKIVQIQPLPWLPVCSRPHPVWLLLLRKHSVQIPKESIPNLKAELLKFQMEDDESGFLYTNTLCKNIF